MSESSYRVLVVDDDEAVRRLTVRALSGEGMVCDSAVDGDQACEMARATRYDVVVTDLRMPNRNGHALAVELLQTEPCPLVFVLTGVTEPRLVRDLLIRGVEDVFIKPVDYRVLAAKVTATLKRRTNQPAAEQPAQSHGQHAPAARSKPVAPQTKTSPEQTTEQAASQTAHPEPTGELTSGPQPTTTLQTKHTAAIFLNNSDRAQELASRLESSTVHVLPVGTTEELHEYSIRQPVDLLIIDNELPGFLCGLEILQRLHSELLRPEAVLLGELSERDVREAAALDIDQIISPDASIDEILQRTQELLDLLSEPNDLIPYAARKIIQKYTGLPPMPQLLVKLVEYMRMDAAEIPLEALARDISVDPQATAELLKLINSSSTGLQHKINTVSDAVNYLGAKRAISLVFASATVAAQSKLTDGWPEPIQNWYHHRTVMIASAAAVFAKHLEKISEDMAFVAGLLQEIGISVLANTSKNRYLETTLLRAREVPQVLLHRAEQEDYRTTHAEVSAALLQTWELPWSLIGPILDHHEVAGQRDRSRKEQSLMRVMRIGEAFANTFDVSHPYRNRQLNDLLAHYGPSKADQCKRCLSEAAARTAESCTLLSMPAPDPEALQNLVKEVTSSSEFVTVQPNGERHQM